MKYMEIRSRTDREHEQSQDVSETQDYPWLGVCLKDDWKQP
jgi:hypothetical protein